METMKCISLSGQLRIQKQNIVGAGGNRRHATGVGVYSDPTTGAQIFNVCSLNMFTLFWRIF